MRLGVVSKNGSNPKNQADCPVPELKGGRLHVIVPYRTLAVSLLISTGTSFDEGQRSRETVEVVTPRQLAQSLERGEAGNRRH